MNRFFAYLSLSLVLVGATAFKQQKRPVTVWMIGDSTMCLYEPSRAPITGWGMPFATFFTKELKFENRAKGGRSTRTFISEDRWRPIADSIAAGDYVLMQFGHNDEAKEEKYKDRYTPVPDYKLNLTKFITETRRKGGVPVLITPVSRMKFDKQNKAQETHADYTAAVYEIGKMMQVPVIDLDRLSRELFDQLGPDRTKMLFMQIEPGINPIYPEGQKDNTHFNELGARRIAELVLHEMQAQKLTLANFMYKPKTEKK
ncbi:rhamnogalacturonan acetylesterase [Pedobacter duraquae]|uniref:Lysophospholipase L1-like esterase n=1 Tax=Pedobacter duraquae TaxID=425511 RepID=A0A4R6IL66_9SPHI|nr:rhamnogalacturonan acetylesterase [Pedobacter duraquae]TDO22791.1 lysophospholipase L1-like esterase [Pedobacter duraquae]